jgi:hypothetical protein
MKEADMSDEKPKLNSELPLGELLRLSHDLAPVRYMKFFNYRRRQSAILNREAAAQGLKCDVFLDLTAIRELLARYRDEETIFDDQGNSVPVGDLPRAEYKLRALWREVEHHNKANGYNLDRLPNGGLFAENIAEQAAYVKLLREEANAMAKLVREADAKAEDYEKRRMEKRQRQPIGSCKRDTEGRVVLVDGMRVDEQGIIEEIGESVDDYLAKAHAGRRARARKARASA